MDSDNLIRMANRIGEFFEAMPDRPEAIEGIATHLKKFWDPRMRRQFLALLEQDDAGRIKDIVRVAAHRHRALLE
ncbi:formate dehydrogenase subunit delta [Xylophilus sp. ASV27]|uniref:formate dehydrogenase subunit delta n=1 Tax=Xylophilus sp. ASV27 TaxID=2795129 RepID=UPI0018EC5208|nr:formate dehydrogenase subunit delta [Xylophilus sp. ASV27]